jgi:hypothetical protein
MTAQLVRTNRLKMAPSSVLACNYASIIRLIEGGSREIRAWEDETFPESPGTEFIFLVFSPSSSHDGMTMAATTYRLLGSLATLIRRAPRFRSSFVYCTANEKLLSEAKLLSLTHEHPLIGAC